MSLYIQPASEISGSLLIPSSKSHTIRALLFGLMASSPSYIIHPLMNSPDVHATIQALQVFGAKVTFVEEQDTLKVEGGFHPAADVVQVGNSGLLLRLLGGLSALLPTFTVFTGDKSLRERRDILPLLQGLRQLGGFATSSLGNGFAPILIRGPLSPGKVSLWAKESQSLSALLMATSFLKGESQIIVHQPKEIPWVKLTLDWLDKFQAGIRQQDDRIYNIPGGLSINGFTYTVPGDFSTAAFPAAATLVSGGSIVLENMDMKDVQGDKKFFQIIAEMGARVEISEDTVTVTSTGRLTGMAIDVDSCVDALPILAVLGCYAEGETILYNGGVCRHKESDRIFSIATELRKMGGIIEERSDGLHIKKSSLQGSSNLQGHHDHRIALSLIIASLFAKGPSHLDGFECIYKTWPNFLKDLRTIGVVCEPNLMWV